MEKTKTKNATGIRRCIYSAVVLLVIALDQLTKYLVVRNFFYGESKPLIDGVVHLTYVTNSGAAFGMLKDHRWVFMVLSTAAILGIYVCLWIFAKRSPLFCTGLALIVGGGIGNMIDRFRLGYVTDFIDLRFINFAVFNVADSFVCIGCAVLFLYLLFFDAKAKDPLFCVKDEKKKSAEGEIPTEKDAEK